MRPAIEEKTMKRPDCLEKIEATVKEQCLPAAAVHRHIHHNFSPSIRIRLGEMKDIVDYIARLEAQQERHEQELRDVAAVACEKQRELCLQNANNEADYPDDEHVILDAPAPDADTIIAQVRAGREKA